MYHSYIFNVDSPLNISLQPSQNTVGQKQQVICSVFVPSDVDPDMVELSWLNEEDIITADSRVTIVNLTNDLANTSFNFSINLITTVIQFDPLYEDDMRNYHCYSIINGSLQFASIQLQNFRSMYMHTYICNVYHVHTLL